MPFDDEDRNNSRHSNDDVGSENTPHQESKTSISPQKLAANQRNAQRSTGPRTDGGKARSSKNSYKHGFFARKLFASGEPAGAEGHETTELGEQIWNYYAPVGYMEELLVEKVVCESVRYGRLLGYEQEEFGRRHAFFAPAVDRVLRYQAAINRQLFQAVKQLEDLQAKRKAQSGGHESEDSSAGEGQGEQFGNGDGVQRPDEDGCPEAKPGN